MRKYNKITDRIIQKALEVEQTNYPLKEFAREYNVDYHRLRKAKNNKKKVKKLSKNT